MPKQPRRNIDIGLLRALVAVVDTGSMTRAAQALSLTQAAISQQIKRLEELLDAQLLVRENSHTKLTAKGERLLSFAHRMISLNDETYSTIVAPEYEGEVRIGVPYDIVRPFIPSILSNFRSLWPNIEISLSCTNTVDLLEKVEKNEIDLTLTTEPHARDCVLLADRLVWVGKRGGTAWRQRPLPVALGNDDCIFRSSIVDALMNNSIDWKPNTHPHGYVSTDALLDADMLVVPLLSQTAPSYTEILTAEKTGLPQLPVFYINLVKSSNRNHLASELADFIEQGFVEKRQKLAS